jgi:quercetin dioxygenase-like cupin family protein
MSPIQLGAIEINFLVEAGDSNGTVTVFECGVPSGARVPAPHSHDAFEETIYGLEGVCTWTVEGTAHEVGRGDSICIKRGQVHGFDNQGADDVKFLAIASPGVFGPAYFEEMADLFASSAGGPPDLEAIGAVMRRHGLTPAKPIAA